MKTLISITAIIGLLFLFSCNSKDQITDPQTSSDITLSKKPDGTGKPNPGQPQVPIITLSINDEPILTENAETNPEGLITLKGDGSDKVTLNVTSAADDPILYVSVEMRYDANVNHSIKLNSEFGGFIYRKDREAFQKEDPTTSLDIVLSEWDLTLMPIASNDPTYTGNFIVTDQFSTPLDLIPSDIDKTTDHYYFGVSVATEKDPWHKVRNWKWVYNPLTPASTSHIADVNYYDIIQGKRSNELLWKVLLHQNDANGVCHPLVNAEAYYWSDDFPEGSGVGRAGVLPTNDEGWQLFTNRVTKRDFPFNRYIVGVQWYSGSVENMSVYKPDDNHEGLGWYPSITVNSPTDLPD